MPPRVHLERVLLVHHLPTPLLWSSTLSRYTPPPKALSPDFLARLRALANRWRHPRRHFR